MHIDYPSLYGILPYLQLFRHKLFVIKLSGELCEVSQTMDSIVTQVALLNAFGIQVVLVHGGGKHATQLGERLGVESEFILGRRVTSAAMIEVIKMSFAGQINTNIMAQLKKHHISAVGISGIDGHLVCAYKRPPLEMQDIKTGNTTVDYGYVAEIQSIQVEVLRDLLNKGYMPVICSLAADEQGQVLNVNADTLATQIAIHLGAEKLCVLGTVDGVMRDLNDPASLFSLLTVTQAQQLLQEEVVTAGMIPKLTNAIEALKHGVKGVHIINGQRPDVLLQEIYTNEGAGTMLVTE